MAISGNCLCGAVTFEGRGDVELDVCHCGMCRRWSGGPHIGAMFKDGVHLLTSDSLRWYDSSEWAERGFCCQCGSTLFYRLKQAPDEISGIAGHFDLPAGLAVKEHIFIEDKPDYYEFADNAPRLTGAEVMARFQEEQAKKS